MIVQVVQRLPPTLVCDPIFQACRCDTLDQYAIKPARLDPNSLSDFIVTVNSKKMVRRVSGIPIVCPTRQRSQSLRDPALPVVKARAMA